MKPPKNPPYKGYSKGAESPKAVSLSLSEPFDSLVVPLSLLFCRVEDPVIGQEVAQSLLQRGRVADAALLLSRLPEAEPLGGELDRAWGDIDKTRHVIES